MFCSQHDIHLHNGSPNYLDNHQVILCTIPKIQEIKKAKFDRSPQKAPWEDGFPLLLYQHCWNIVASSLHDFVRSIWRDPYLIIHGNKTLLVLIPKINQPEFLIQFHLISPSNIVYKLVTKIMVNNVKPLLNNIISLFGEALFQGEY